MVPERIRAGELAHVAVEVENAGARAGEEVVQLYVTDREASSRVPIRSLQGYRRVHLRPGESQRVEFQLEPWQLAVVTDGGRRVVEPGEFEVSVGGKQPGFSGRPDAETTEVLTGVLHVTGESTEVEVPAG